jgi:hypothetical protein
MPIIPNSDGPPDGFETQAQAMDERAYRIHVLLGGNRQERRLAAKLRRCRKGTRCNNGAGNVCTRLFRLRLLRQSHPILDSRPNWTRALVVPADLLFVEGELANVDLNVHQKQNCQATGAVELTQSHCNRWHRHFI